MNSTAAQAWVAGLYDAYVTTTADHAFFLAEVCAAGGPILELMAGTGRLSLPLAEAGADLTCVDLSGPMLDRLRAKLAAKGLHADVVEADIRELALPRRDFALAILPFQSFAELLTPEDQLAALARVAHHLAPDGRFICTLHNPVLRARTIDGQLRLLGSFPLPDRAATLLLWSTQQLLPDGVTVRAAQLYEIYDRDGRLSEKRRLDVRFRLVGRAEFEALARSVGFRVVALCGDYDRSPIADERSPCLIWTLAR